MAMHSDRKEQIWFWGLLGATLLTTTLAGMMWTTGKSLFTAADGTFNWPSPSSEDWIAGLTYSLPFLGILTIHEFAHYGVAKYYKIATTLPRYIPLWFFDMPTIGTLGAFIRIKGPIETRKQFFDVGIAGPLAGFFAACVVLVYGFTHLPPADYIFNIHPEYKSYGAEYADHVYQNVPGLFGVGDNLLMMIMKHMLVDDPSRMPNPYELIHYPYLFAGFLALFFTALNLLPIGQLDGGHVLYGFTGAKLFNKIAPYLFTGFILYAGIGVLQPKTAGESIWWQMGLYLLYLWFIYSKVFSTIVAWLQAILCTFIAHYAVGYFLPEWEGSISYLVFGFVLSRFLGVYHPTTLIEQPIGTSRIFLGIFAGIVFILCFTPHPFIN